MNLTMSSLLALSAVQIVKSVAIGSGLTCKYLEYGSGIVIARRVNPVRHQHPMTQTTICTCNLY
jgi:hypothetical protein